MKTIADREGVNLEEVAKLLAALERDLARVSSGSEDLQTLRNEVETLKNVLNSPTPKHHWVRDGLTTLRSMIGDALGTVLGKAIKANEYVKEIGRILGL